MGEKYSFNTCTTVFRINRQNNFFIFHEICNDNIEKGRNQLRRSKI